MEDFIDKSISKIICENFDITDRETRKTLLAVNEADQNQILVKLASKLYDNIINKVDDIDFGSIPKTKGDITKLDNYSKLVECIDVMHSLIKEYNQDTSSIDVIEEALKNIESRKDEFEKSFRYNVEMSMLIYCSVSLAIVSSTSLMISSCIEFIKSPTQDDFQISLDKISLARTKESLLFNNLKRFNKICDNKSLDKTLDHLVAANTKGFIGADDLGIIMTGVAMTTIILNIVPILRELIFFFFNTRTKISDYFEVQADLLQMNAYNIQNNDLIKKSDRDKISKKQLKIVSAFKKISNFFNIEGKKAEAKAKKDIPTENKKYKTKELLDVMPDSASSSSALF